ncbi:MAG TPA: CcmD family protein [Patescibacteria group bacterium]|nr:CcmD family protein [Patescibacteria group bacterium]
MDNLTLLGIVITVVWLGVFGYYFYTSRQQSEIFGDIDELQAILETRERSDES